MTLLILSYPQVCTDQKSGQHSPTLSSSKKSRMLPTSTPSTPLALFSTCNHSLRRISISTPKFGRWNLVQTNMIIVSKRPVVWHTWFFNSCAFFPPSHIFVSPELSEKLWMFTIWMWNLKRYSPRSLIHSDRRGASFRILQGLSISELFNPEPVTASIKNANILHIYFPSTSTCPLWMNSVFSLGWLWVFHEVLMNIAVTWDVKEARGGWGVSKEEGFHLAYHRVTHYRCVSPLNSWCRFV